MEKITKNKPLMIGLIVVIILIVIFAFTALTKNTSKISPSTENVLPVGDVVPTVDSSVVVNVEPLSGNKEITLTIDNLPKGTTSVEYELSYNAKGNVPKGVIGTIDTTAGENIERKITLGTCSSGKCIYDEGVTDIKVSLKFNGDYGARSFEKDFPLE
jgi:hypothetical protein